MLTGGARTAVARQRTLEATVIGAISCSRCPNANALPIAVFPATWTLEAAEQICGGDGIGRRHSRSADLLVGKSLVVAETAFGERRYRLLETIRHYARVRLAEKGANNRLTERHFEFFFGTFRDVFRLTRHQNSFTGCAAWRWSRTTSRGARLGLVVSRAFRQGCRAVRCIVLVLDKARIFRKAACGSNESLRPATCRLCYAGARVNRLGAHASLSRATL